MPEAHDRPASPGHPAAGTDRPGTPHASAPHPDDHFARLLARHGARLGSGAAADATAAAPVARLRPRLPQPFERVEVLGGEPVGTEAVAFQAPGDDPASRPRSVAPLTGTTHHDRAVRTRWREAADAPPPATDGRAAAPPGPAHPVPGDGPRRATLRPAPEGTRPRRTGAPAAPTPSVPQGQPAAAAPTPPAGAGAVPGAPTAPVPPRAAAAGDAATARAAARNAAARRASRAAEPTIHVQIGRLEVSAAPATAGDSARERRARGRRGPAVSLDDYLARDTGRATGR